MNTRPLRTRLDRHLADYRAAVDQLGRERTFLDRAEAHLGHVRRALGIAQAAAQTVQQQAQEQVAGVVTRCLQAVFGEDAYEFRIRFEQKRGRTEARLLFARDGHEVDPVEAAGGGVVDLASFALRLACLVLQRPRRRLLLCLDEPFRFVSRDYLPAVRRLLETLAGELKVQIILVTHHELLKAGKVTELDGRPPIDP